MQPGKGFNGTLPGVPALLETLQAREDVFLGLLTGNFRDGARIKLERFDLWRYFRCGAFGDDSPDRNALVPVALERAAACGMVPLQPADVLVVGDTPNDVACAQVVGAVPVGVATGTLRPTSYAGAGRRSCSRRWRMRKGSGGCCSGLVSACPGDARRAPSAFGGCRRFGATAFACYRLAGLPSRSSPAGRAKAGGSAWESNPARPPSAGGDRF